jgi:hypothetical protein
MKKATLTSLVCFSILCFSFILSATGQERRRIFNGADTVYSEKMVTPDTKLIVKSAEGLGKFYLYMDSVLINRSPQLQVGVVDLFDKEAYSIRVVFQNRDLKPVTGVVKPTFEQTKLYVIYSGSRIEVEQQKAQMEGKEEAMSGDIAPDSPGMPEYKGRLGCDYPIGEEVIEQYLSLMTSINERTPMEWAYELVTTQCLNTRQLAEILDVFKTDEEKIELSKTAWYYLYNQEDFHTLANHFTNHTAVDVVMEYVQHNQ